MLPEPVLVKVSATPLALDSATLLTLESLANGPLAHEVNTPQKSPSSTSHGTSPSEASTPCKELDTVQWNPTTEKCASPLPVEVVGLDALRNIDGTSPSATRFGARARRPLVVDILRGEAVEGIAERGGSPELNTDAVAASGSAWAKRLGRSSVGAASAMSTPSGEAFVNRALQFFVVHFVLLYAVQILGQVRCHSADQPTQAFL